MSLATISVDTATALGREYLTGGPRAALGATPRVLSRTPDDISREFGPGFWDLVAQDPKVSSSIAILCDAAVGDGPTLTPAIAAPKKAPRDPADAPTEADIAEARRIARLCEWNLARLERPLDETLKAMLADALAGGCKLAEMTYEQPESGEYRDTYALKALKIKPGDVWRFVVDKYMNVLGIQAEHTFLGWDGGSLPGDLDGFADRPRRAIVPRERFAILTWDSRDGDPRGRSILRTIYEAWNFKTRALPEYFQFMQTFASPTAVATYPTENLGDAEKAKAASDLEGQMRVFGQARYLVAPDGTTVDIHYPQGKGDPFLAGLDWADGQIVSGILGATRMTEEAQHGSKADSETAADVVALRIRRIKATLRRLIEWDVCWNLVRVNEGREAADRFTPVARFGQDRKDFLSLVAVVKALFDVGALQPQMLPAVVDLFGLDIPEPDPAKAEARQQPAQDPADPNAPAAPADPNDRPSDRPAGPAVA